MADMANIVDFNNSDGLPPEVVKKLNNNFWWAVRKIPMPEVVIIASVTEPKPRTDETLWYKTDTGDLYLWSYFPDEVPHWDWKKLPVASDITEAQWLDMPGFVAAVKEIIDNPGGY